MKNNKKHYDIILVALVGVVIGYALCGTWFFNNNVNDINLEERTNEILAMDSADVIDEFIPCIRTKLESISNETSDDLVRAIINELGSTFEEVGKEAYIAGYRASSQGIGVNIPASD